jgi:hypothetical protein
MMAAAGAAQSSRFAHQLPEEEGKGSPIALIQSALLAHQ